VARKPSEAKEFPQLKLPGAGFPETLQPAVSVFNRAAEEIHAQLNGRISMGTKPGAWAGHIDGEILQITAPSAATDFPVTHSLGRIPLGWIPLSGDGLSRVNITPAHTTKQLWLRAAVAGTRYLLLVF
jgi:hypothetical protein